MIIKNLSLKSALIAGSLALAGSFAQADSAGQDAVSVLSVAKQNGDFSTLTRAIEAAGLADTLSAQGPMTIFAPTDEAFAKLPAGTLENLLKPENKDQLVKLLSNHVVSGETLEQDELKTRRTIETGAEQDLRVALVNGRLRVGDARVSGDIDAGNGVIMPIDRVLLPK